MLSLKQKKDLLNTIKFEADYFDFEESLFLNFKLVLIISCSEIILCFRYLLSQLFRKSELIVMIKSRGLIIITLILSLFNVSWPKRRFRSLISERKGPWRGPCHSCAMRTGFKKCDSVQLTQRTFKGWPYKISCELLYHRMDEYNAIAPVDEYFLYNEGEGSGKGANPNATVSFISKDLKNKNFQVICCSLNKYLTRVF